MIFKIRFNSDKTSGRIEYLHGNVLALIFVNDAVAMMIKEVENQSFLFSDDVDCRDNFM